VQLILLIRKEYNIEENEWRNWKSEIHLEKWPLWDPS
jgi:hypothetical protein